MKRRLLPGLALAATLAIAAPAGAASWVDPGEPTYVPTPEGKLDHYAYDYEIDLEGEPHMSSRMEAWVSADRSRTVFSRGGTLLTEDATEGAEWRVFYADVNEIRIRPLKTAGRPVVHTLRSAAAINREQVDLGWLKVDGETTVDGRRALVLVDGPKDPDAHHNSERLVVDAESFVELEAERRATAYREDGSSIQSVSRRKLVLNETVALAGAEGNLAFGDHPGAKVTRLRGLGEDEVATAARRKSSKAAKQRAAARRRAAARKRAAARRRAAR